MAIDASEWLESWVDGNLHEPLYQENKSAMAGYARTCRSDAKAAGISSQALVGAAGGDLEGFLLDRQNALTDAEVQRRVAKDD